MNVHDSERLAGLLETAGYVDLASIPAAERPATADVVVFNTCAVRENADNKLYGNLGQLRPAKTANPDLQIAVGGCMAQKDRDTIVKRAPGSTSSSAPTTSAALRRCSTERATTSAPRSRSSSRSRPSRRLSRPAVTVRMPRGSRSASGATTPAPSASSRACAARSRTVDPATSSPRCRRSSTRASSRSPCWGRTSTPMASSSATRAPSPSCSAPAARSTAWNGCVSPARTQRPSPMTSSRPWPRHQRHAAAPHAAAVRLRPRAQGDAALLSQREVPRHPRQGARPDPRCGDHDRSDRRFPGETEEDFAQTLRVVEASRFSSAFTFQYSIRPGHSRSDDGGPGSQSRCARTFRPPHRPAGGGLLGGEPPLRRA